MKHLKLYEEYNLFKASRKSYDRYNVLEPKGTPYYNLKSSDKNIKDPNEPFLYKNKYKYFQDKRMEVSKQVEDLNDPIKFAELEKMGLNQRLLNKFKVLAPNGYHLEIDNPYFVKELEYYATEIYFLSDVYGHGTTTPHIHIKYFIPEKDYIFQTLNHENKPIKKRFENPEDGINWVIELYENRIRYRRNSLRVEDE